MARYAEANVADGVVLIEIDPAGSGTTSVGSLADWAGVVAAVAETIGTALQGSGRAEVEFGVSITEDGQVALVSPERAAVVVRIPAKPPGAADLELPAGVTPQP